MNAFISYSLPRSQQYILTILSQELAKSGFRATVGSVSNHGHISPFVKGSIAKADLFIGFYSEEGARSEQLRQEWNFANEMEIPAILLYEGNIEIKKYDNAKYIPFNRKNPGRAIINLTRQIDLLKEKKEDANALKFILGGTALLLIMNLFSDSKK